MRHLQLNSLKDMNFFQKSAICDGLLVSLINYLLLNFVFFCITQYDYEPYHSSVTQVQGRQMQEPGADVVEKAFQLCKGYLGGAWSRMTPNHFKLTELGSVDAIYLTSTFKSTYFCRGGLTNKLYICSLLTNFPHNEDHPNTVLLRLYGLILQDFPAQIQENVVFSILAERGIGPRLFGVFSGGRLEEYIQSRTLRTADLLVPSTSDQIAVRMAEYHRLVMPVQKEPTFITFKLFNYLEKIQGATFNTKHKQDLYDKFMGHNLDEEVKYLRNMILELEAVVVFCHNDAQEGNILIHTNNNSESNPIQLIDYEYSCYNYRGFDLANHFCEWTYDYSHQSWPFFINKKENFPDKSQQLRFVRAYLDSMFAAVPARKHDVKWSAARILYESDRFVLMSHLFWALWSVRQAMISDIKFGYLEYALVRLDDYFQHKKLIH